MIWGTETHGAMTYDEAARSVGMTTRAMRKALDKPHVQQHLREQRHVLRTTLSARTLSRLAELRDQDDNRNAAVAAARALEGLGDEPVTNTPHRPGVVIVIGGPARELAQIPPTASIPIDDDSPVPASVVLPNLR